MKKTMIVAAVAGLFAASAQAQSSVTLYGVVDAGMTFATSIRDTEKQLRKVAEIGISVVENGQYDVSNVWGIHSGNASGSQFGLRGVEDLGSGLKATFVLENGFSVTRGTLNQGKIFGRQAYVGISSDEWGELSLGRQYEVSYDFLSPFTLSGTGQGGPISGVPFDNDNLSGTIRADNSIKFTSTDSSGLKFSAMYGFSNTLRFERGRSFGGGASYNFDGLNVAVAYYRRNAEEVTGETPATLEVGRSTVYGIGADYAIGSVQVSTLFTKSKNDNPVVIYPKMVPNMGRSDTFYGDFVNVYANARYNLTPAWNVSGQYTFTKLELGGAVEGDEEDPPEVFSPSYHNVTLRTGYALSKRTDLYLMGTFQRSHKAAKGTYINRSGPSPRQNASTLTAGLRHRF